MDDFRDFFRLLDTLSPPSLCKTDDETRALTHDRKNFARMYLKYGAGGEQIVSMESLFGRQNALLSGITRPKPKSEKNFYQEL